MQSTARPTLGLLALSATLALSAAVVSAPRPALAQSAQAKAAYDEGIRFKQAKDHKAAAGAFERALQLDGRYAAAWTELGNSRLALGQTDSAIEAFKSALAIDPNDQTARYNAAYALRQQRRYEEAAEAYQQYLQRSPNDPDAHYGLAESLKAANKPLAAAEAFEAYARTEKRATWQKWVAKAKTEATALRAQAAAAPAPTAPAVSVPTAATAAAVVKQPRQQPATPAAAATPAPAAASPAPVAVAPAAAAPTAVADVAPARTARPESFTAGLNQLRAGSFDDALVRLEVARRESGDDPFVLAALAAAHLGRLEGEEAERLYRQALDVADAAAQPGLYLGLGEALRVQGRVPDARDALRKAAGHADASDQVVRIAQERLATL